MRRAIGLLLSTIGWILLVYFGILAFVLLVGLAHPGEGSRVALLTGLALPVGAAFVLTGSTLQRRGPIWRRHRERQYLQRDQRLGPFGRPRGTGPDA